MEKITIIKKEIISEIKFENGNVLSVGDVFEDGRIILFNILEEGVEVVLEWEWEGWSVLLNWDGELMD
jgi:predicted thioredoxin/glutaredoxin